MSAMAFQITDDSIVYSNVCSCADHRKPQTVRRWPFWGESTGDRCTPLTKGQQRWKCFHLMTSSCDMQSDPSCQYPSVVMAGGVSCVNRFILPATLLLLHVILSVYSISREMCARLCSALFGAVYVIVPSALIWYSGLILSLRRAIERRRYLVTTSHIGWVQAQN